MGLTMTPNVVAGCLLEYYMVQAGQIEQSLTVAKVCDSLVCYKSDPASKHRMWEEEEYPPTTVVKVCDCSACSQPNDRLTTMCGKRSSPRPPLPPRPEPETQLPCFTTHARI